MSNGARRLLLDTHALVDYVRGGVLKTSLEAQLDESRGSGRLYVSSVSFWEVALLVQKGRLALGNVLRWAEQVLSASGIKLLPPGIAEMIASAALPPHHKDPFDRLIVAQAKAAGMEIVTGDERISDYRVKVLWK